ncbi:MAG: sortase [Romboutsia sp.]|uniref:sortase n=1 Tax=Romboutsia sp. TaxID=1965302 RepID=UPI003F3C7C75
MSKYKNQFSKLLTICGVICVLLASVISAYDLYKDYRGMNSSQYALGKLKSDIINDKSMVNVDNMSRNEGRMSSVEIDGIKYIGIIVIPRLNISLPIQDEWSKEALDSSPCRYTGSIYENNMVIMGHNFRSHFAGLKNLSSGDKVYFVDVYGDEYSYTVTYKELLNKTQVSNMVDNQSDLTLFTCDLYRNKRITIRLDKDI